MDEIKEGDFLFGYPIVRVNGNEAEVRLPLDLTIYVGFKQTAQNIANLLRQWGIWVPQSPVGI